MEEFDLNMRDAQRWIDKGRVLINDIPIQKKSQEILGEIEVITFEPTTQNLLPIFETREFALYDKPSGILIHPSNRNTSYSLTHEVKYQFGKDANITHRIDKETSGIIIVSKYKQIEKKIKTLFEEKKVKKTYLAFVKGNINKNLKIDAPILKNRDFSTIKLKVIIDKNGKPSQTLIEPIMFDKKRDITLIKAFPLTGRQHQIRVHLSHINHPIIGDPIYGVDTNFANRYLDKTLSQEERIATTGADRVMLHAHSVEFFLNNLFYLKSRYSSTFYDLFSRR
jgi:23S rRNA pseudouridine1911/1915/1917 synthase